MTAIVCRLCRDPLAGAPRLTIPSAPSGAQHFAATPELARARRITLEIAECPSCGLVQSLSAPVDGFRRAITAAGVSAPMRAHRLAQANRLREAQGAIASAGGRIALIGCGNGYELALLAEAGFTPEGVEAGGAPAGYDGPWPVHDGYPEPGPLLPGAPYEAAACYNFLEHAPDPRGFLRATGAALTPSGVGVFEVPNYDRQRAEGRAADYIADHLSYFDARTFRALLLVAGFDVLSMAEVRDGENIEAIVRQRVPTSMAHEQAQLGMVRRGVELFFSRWREAGRPAVAWGASHQAMTLFGGMDAHHQPAVILDSATFKHGTFAPPSGIAVVAPSAEALSGAGAVLVVASGYEREIVHALRVTHGFAGEVWTIRGHHLHRVD